MSFSSFPYIVSHRTLLYFRVRVPQRLQACLGRQEYRRSLGTAYLHQAKPVAIALAVRMMDVFRLADVYLTATAKGQVMPDPTTPEAILTNERIRAIADRALEEGLASVFEHRIKKFRGEGATYEWIEAQEEHATDAKMAIAYNELYQYREPALRLLKEHHIHDIDVDGMPFLRLCRALAAVQHVVNDAASDMYFSGTLDETQQATYEKLIGIPKTQAAHVSTPLIKAAELTEAERTPLSKAIDTYIAAEKRNWVTSTLMDKTQRLKQFSDICREICNHDITIAKLDRPTIQAFRELLPKLPPRASELARQGSSYSQLSHMKHDKLLHPTTVINHLNAIRAFILWSETEYEIRGKFLVRYLDIGEPPPSERRPPTTEELQAIFAPSAYLEATQEKPEFFWSPLIALYTGARLEEIAQLTSNDIKEKDGTLFFDFNDLSDEKHLKTKASRRNVPIHPFLVELGLVDFAKSADGTSRIFSNLNQSSRGRLSHTISDWFRDYRRSRGVIDGSVVFHSFRHLFITMSTEREVNRHLLKKVVGHDESLKDITDRYTKDISLPVLMEKVVAIHNWQDELPLRELAASPHAKGQRKFTVKP